MRRNALATACCAVLGITGLAAAQPVNDSCNAPLPIDFGIVTNGTTVGAVDNPQLALSNTWCSSDPLDVWYTFDPAPNTEYRVELLGVTGSGHVCISVMDACNGTDNPSGIGIGDADDGFAGDIIGFDFTSAASGDPVLVRVGSQGTGHDFSILISEPPPAPANDLCSSAILVPSVPFFDSAFDLERAGHDPDIASCNAANDTGLMNNAVWWRFEGNDANIRVAFNDFEFTGAYGVYVGSCGSLSEVACASIGAQTIDFFAAAGSTYYFVIMHNAQLPIHDIGNYATIDVSFAPVGPANDACFNAVAVNLDSPVQGDTTGATGSDLASCGSDERDVWYTFTPVANATYNIEAVAFVTSLDVGVSVYEGFCPFSEDLDVGCATASSGVTSLLYTADCNGTPIWIRVASDQTEEAEFSLLISAAGPAPVNDRCCNAQALTLNSPALGSTTGASRNQSGVAGCGSHQADVWYTFTPATSGSFRVSVSDPNTTRTTSISAFSGCPEFGGLELNCRSANDPSIDFVASAGLPVYLRVGSSHTSTVDFSIEVVAETIPTDCENARIIPSVPFSDTWVGIQDAFADVDVRSCGSSTGQYMPHAVWWRFDGDGQRIRVTMDDGSGFSGAFTVLEASFGCSFFNEIFCATGGPETIDIETQVGATYYFVVANNSSIPLSDTNNDATIDVQIAPPIPVNDECGDAIALTEGVPTAGTTVAAGGFGSTTCSSSNIREVWYSFDPAPNTRYFITISDASSSGTLAIFNLCSDFVEQFCVNATNPQIDFTSDIAGNPFIIMYGTSLANETTFNILVEEAPNPPPNNECLSATSVTPGVPVAGTTNGADGTDVASCGADEWDVWYTLTATNGVRYRATARNVTGAVSIAAFAGCETAEISCDTGSATSLAFVEFVGEGAPVWIRVASNTGDIIDFEFIAEIANAPANDSCDMPEPIFTGVDTPGTTFFATEDAGIPGTVCGSDEWDVWYVFDPEPTTTYQVSVTGFDATPSIGLFSACNVSSTQCDSSAPFMLQFDSNASGDPVLFRVASDGSLQQETDFVIRVDERAPPPANDLCANAIDLTRGVPANGTTAGATQDGTASCGADEWDVWYTFTPLPSTSYRLRLNNISTSASLAVFDACGGSELFCDTGTVALPPLVNFTSDSLGSPLTFRVATDEGLVEETDFQIVVDFPPPPPANDDCFNATVVSLNEILAGTTIGATQDGTASCGSDELDVWYFFDPEPNTAYRVRTTDTTGALSLAVFDSCGGTEIDCATGGSVVPHVDFISDAMGTPIVARVASDEGSFEEIDFVFTVNLAVPPANDLCASATVVDLSSGPFLDFQDTVGATDDGDSFSCATSSPNGNKSIWYSVTTTSTMELVATVNPVFYNPNLVVYTGTCGAWTEIVCDANNSNGAIDTVTWTAEANTTYLVSVSEDGSFARGGLTDISIRSTCPCEYNGQAGVDVFDLLSYLDLWFANAAGAELDGNGAVDVFDLLAYLDCWFPASAGNPCP